MDTLKKSIDALAKKAADTKEASHAMHFAQAALSLAQAYGNIKAIDNEVK